MVCCRCCCGAAACVGFLGAHSRTFQQALATDITQLHSDVESVLDALPHFSGESDSDDSPANGAVLQQKQLLNLCAAADMHKKLAKSHTSSSWQMQHKARRQYQVMNKTVSATNPKKRRPQRAAKPTGASTHSAAAAGVSPTQPPIAAPSCSALGQAAQWRHAAQGAVRTTQHHGSLKRGSGIRQPYSRKSKHRMPAHSCEVRTSLISVANAIPVLSCTQRLLMFPVDTFWILCCRVLQSKIVAIVFYRSRWRSVRLKLL